MTTTITKTVSSNNWSGSIAINGDLGTEGFDISNAYNIRLQVSDELSTKTFDVTLTSGTPAMSIYKNKIAIGKQYDTGKGEILQVGGNEVVDGDLMFKNNADTGGQQIKWLVGTDDAARVYGGATAKNAGFLEIATADGGNEPIYARQYTGNFFLLTRTATLLDENGNTTFPGTVTASSFNGKATESGKTTNSILTNTNPSSGTWYYPWWGVNSSGETTPRANNGLKYFTQEGTASALGHGIIQLGNEVAERTAGNKRGRIRLCGKGAVHTDIYTNATANKTINFPDEDGTIQCKPTNLYNNSSGATGTITLSQTAANFNYIEIFYRNNDNRYSSTRVYRPTTGTNNIWLSAGFIYNDIKQVYIKAKEIVINGTSLTVTRGVDLAASFDYDSATNATIYIIRVDGYK